MPALAIVRVWATLSRVVDRDPRSRRDVRRHRVLEVAHGHRAAGERRGWVVTTGFGLVRSAWGLALVGRRGAVGWAGRSVVRGGGAWAARGRTGRGGGRRRRWYGVPGWAVGEVFAGDGTTENGDGRLRLRGLGSGLGHRRSSVRRWRGGSDVGGGHAHRRRRGRSGGGGDRRRASPSRLPDRPATVRGRQPRLRARETPAPAAATPAAAPATPAAGSRCVAYRMRRHVPGADSVPAPHVSRTAIMGGGTITHLPSGTGPTTETLGARVPASTSYGGSASHPTVVGPWPGRPNPLGATWDGEGTNFALYAAGAEAVDVCLFDAERHGDPASPSRSRPTTSGTATCPRCTPASATASASTARSTRPTARAGTRASCSPTPTPAPSTASSSSTGTGSGQRRGLRLPAGPRRPGAGPPRLGAVRPQVGRRPRRLPLGRRRTAADRLVRLGDLRAARQGLHQAAPAHPGEPPRHLRRPRPPGDDRLPDRARGHGDRAAAGAPLRQRALRAEARADQLLGLQHPRLLRPARRLRRERRRPVEQVREFKAMVRAMHAAGIEVILDVVYNHTAEADELGPDAVLPRHRQRRLLPAARGGQAALHRLHRLRQHPRRPPPARAPDDHGLAALLGHRDARRRLPLRPRGGAGPVLPRRRQALGVLRRDPAGPGRLARSS